MKITNNSIGNYSLYSINKPLETTSISAEAVSKEEKIFFVKMYPQNKTEIMDYHFYQRTGKMSGVGLGSMFDKRG